MDKNKTIFAIDDETPMHFVYEEILAEHYNLFCFASPQEMLHMLENICPDLIIMDIELGEMNGYELCKAIKQKEGLELVPVVFVSRHDFSKDKGRAFFSGGSEYVMKPIDKTPFNKLIKKLIEDHEPMTAPEGQ